MVAKNNETTDSPPNAGGETGGDTHGHETTSVPRRRSHSTASVDLDSHFMIHESSCRIHEVMKS